MPDLPAFYCTKTLMGFGQGPDLNRVTLECPDGTCIVLFEMNEPREPATQARMNALAAKLSELWKKREEEQ